MKQEVIIRNIEDLERAAKEFLNKIGDRTLVAFFAPMGLSLRELCRLLW
jgi:hypothetical protein